MECKFLKHGLAPGYNGVVKPCCVWTLDEHWKSTQTIDIVDLKTWHRSPEILVSSQQLELGQWPKSCKSCEASESQGRTDSVRLNGNQAYQHYQDEDITLEIRPGNTCNFACQTCWPEASSRVAQYYHQLGWIDIKNLDSKRYDDFDWLLPVAQRVKDVIVLGGEPFYDKSCQKFLVWAQQNLTANLLMFTNGSMIDWEFLETYPGKITLVFSLDAMGLPAEYIRFGTVWSTVLDNFLKARTLPNVEIRVNITTSFYNYIYIEELIEFLCQNWPSVVSFGSPRQAHFNESSVPDQYRSSIIASLQKAIEHVKTANIELGQQSNAINTLTAHVNNLKTVSWSPENFARIKQQIVDMDRVKGINIADYCLFTARMLSH